MLQRKNQRPAYCAVPLSHLWERVPGGRERARPHSGRVCFAFLFLAVLLATAALASPPPEHLPLWPDVPPGSEGLTLDQRITQRSDDPAYPDRYVEEVAAPWLTIYHPERPNGHGLLVIPGGGYQRVVLDKEGTALVPEFVWEAGLTLFILHYRLPGEGHAVAKNVPLADARRAMRLIRARADAWGVHPETLGVIGFSAGGHLAAHLATSYADAVSPPLDTVDDFPARPAYALLMYPVIDMGEYAHQGSRQRLLGDAPSAEDVRRYSPQHQVHPQMPPVFLLHAEDDPAVKVENSQLMAAALRKAGIKHELHLYAEGGHGFGIRYARGSLRQWPQLALAFIEMQIAEVEEDAQGSHAMLFPSPTCGRGCPEGGLRLLWEDAHAH